MHIPPYFKKRTWQFFFIGVIVGAVIGYLFFLYVYGEHTERWIEENLSLRDELREVEKANDLLKRDQDNLSRESEKKLTIQETKIEWLNASEQKIDRFTVYHLTELVEKELNPVIGRNIDAVSDQRDLLIRAIENKEYKISNLKYSVKVVYLTISTKLTISLEVKQQSS
ncbi:sporulation membrane protein YtrI [Bacillaceae bacterium W0354]